MNHYKKKAEGEYSTFAICESLTTKEVFQVKKLQKLSKKKIFS